MRIKVLLIIFILFISSTISYAMEVPPNYLELLEKLNNMPEGAEIPAEYQQYMKLLDNLPAGMEMPEGMPEGIPEEMPERMPEGILNNLPTGLLSGTQVEEKVLVPEIPLDRISLYEAKLNKISIKNMEYKIKNDIKYKNLDSIVVLKDGKIAYEKYFNNLTENTYSPAFSVTKSITSLLVGIAEDKGFINTEDKVLKYFDKAKLKNVNSLKENMKIKHLLTMQSGLKWGEEKDFNVFVNMYTKALNPFTKINIPYEMMSLPMDSQPGTKYDYNSMNGNIIDEIIFKGSGQHLKEFADENLFGPLGITNYVFEKANDGSYFGGKGLQLTAIDMAKLGYLVENDGVFNEKQIISKEYLHKSTSRYASRDNTNNLNYGYSWNFDEGAIRAAGAGGQRIDIYKTKGLVIVYKIHTDIYGESTKTIDFDISKLTNNYILKTIK